MTDSMRLEARTAARGVWLPLLRYSDNNAAYGIRNFRPQPLAPGRKVPVLLVGSFWPEPEHPGLTRFCMINEMTPDRSDEAFGLMPHYYVFSIELRGPVPSAED